MAILATLNFEYMKKINVKFAALCMAAFMPVFCAMGKPALPPEGWTITADDYDGEYTGIPVANGRIGILPWRQPGDVRHVMLNHVFDFPADGEVNRALRGVNPLKLNLYVDGSEITDKEISRWRQTLDMRHAHHITSFVADNKVSVSYTITALRNMPYAATIEVELQAISPCSVKIESTADVPDDYKEFKTKFKNINADGKDHLILHTDAVSFTGRHRSSSAALWVSESGVSAEAPAVSFDLGKGDKAEATLAASFCTSRDFIDPLNEVDRQVIYIAERSPERLTEDHDRLWDKLWEGDVIIEGDPEAQRAVRLALYSLYSFCRKGSGLSIAPMGLSSQGYNGHIFWDSEIWMYPPMLFVNPDIARSMIDYRSDRLDAARTRASVWGYEGAMFPWESDDYGQESCPTWALTGSMEHHVTPDIAIAAWNYYCATADKDWLKAKGWPLIRDIADFCVSRAEKDHDGNLTVRNVVGADEYAIGVDDNAFTNGAMICALRDAVKAAKVVGEIAPKEWSETADAIPIYKNNDGVTLEHKAYNGEMIKQADVNLLAYPLGLITDKSQIERDLDYYTAKIDTVNGPAMAYGVMAVSLARIGRTDEALAMFRRAYEPNARKPFGAFAETAAAQNPYFATGAGALLQGVINGWCGLELTDSGIEQIPVKLPESWKSVTVTGVGPEKKTFVNRMH